MEISLFVVCTDEKEGGGCLLVLFLLCGTSRSVVGVIRANAMDTVEYVFKNF